MPLAMLWVSKLILDGVVAYISRGGGNLRHIWDLVILELGLAVASDVLGRLNTLCDSLLGDRFTNRVSIRLMEHADRLDLASFEDPVFYDKLDRARRQTTGRMGLLASVLGLCQDTLSLVSLSAGLIVFSPWLMVLLPCWRKATWLPCGAGGLAPVKALPLAATPALPLNVQGDPDGR